MHQLLHKSVIASACVAAAFLGVSFSRAASVRAEGQARDVTITADQFRFSPARIEVQKDDLVKVTFSAGDIPHSFTVDNYRIAKRAGAGQTVVFEFRADQSGTFPFYCNLSQDDRCRQMKGELVVK